MTRKKTTPSPADSPPSDAIGPEPDPGGGVDEVPTETAPWDDQPTVNLTGDPPAVAPRDDAASEASDAAEDKEAAGPARNGNRIFLSSGSWMTLRRS